MFCTSFYFCFVPVQREVQNILCVPDFFSLKGSSIDVSTEGTVLKCFILHIPVFTILGYKTAVYDSGCWYKTSKLASLLNIKQNETRDIFEVLNCSLFYSRFISCRYKHKLLLISYWEIFINVYVFSFQINLIWWQTN